MHPGLYQKAVVLQQLSRWHCAKNVQQVSMNGIINASSKARDGSDENIHVSEATKEIIGMHIGRKSLIKNCMKFQMSDQISEYMLNNNACKVVKATMTARALTTAVRKDGPLRVSHDWNEHQQEFLPMPFYSVALSQTKMIENIGCQCIIGAWLSWGCIIRSWGRVRMRSAFIELQLKAKANARVKRGMKCSQM